jgi:polyhydroxyalkanoate synthesis regulator phasin
MRAYPQSETKENTQMDRSTKTKIIAGAVAAAAIAGGGAAVAATQLRSPSEESQAIVNDAAAQLGVQPQALSNALRKAVENRIDAAVTDGRLTKEQGDALKQRIESGQAPLFFGPGFGGHDHGHLGDLDAAASYLGLTEDQLRTQLQSGKTLADVAKAQGKSVDGLIDALVAVAKKHLDDAVADGRLTKAQADQILSDLKQRITDRANGKLPQFNDRPGFRPVPEFSNFA